MLEREGIPAPNGGRRWNTTTLRDIVLDDCYRPHSYSEICELVSSQVAAELDESSEASYGICWYGRRRTSVKQVAEEDPSGTGRRYRWVQSSTWRPRSEWVAIPVPDAGILREWADAARESVKSNRRFSSAGDRFWQLSGGVIYCGGCGHRMVPSRHCSRKSQPYKNYYRCETRHKFGAEGCPMPRSWRADEIEPAVWEFVRGLLEDPERLRTGLEELIERERDAGSARDPGREQHLWLQKLAEISLQRSRAQDLAIEGLLDRDELRARLAALEETRRTAERELAALSERKEKLESLERDAESLLAHYGKMVPGALDYLTPEERRRVYEMLRLRITTHPNGTIEAAGVFANTADPKMCVETEQPHDALGAIHGAVRRGSSLGRVVQIARIEAVLVSCVGLPSMNQTSALYV